MGNDMSLFSCGVVEALIGDPDWTVGLGGVRPSASRMERKQRRAVNEIRTEIARRQELVQSLQRDINQCQQDAAASKRALTSGRLSGTSQRDVMRRAKMALQTIASKQSAIRKEQTLIATANRAIDNIESVQRTDDDRQLLSKITKLASNLQLDESRIDDLTEAGTDVLEMDDSLSQFVNASNNNIDMFEQTMNDSTNSMLGTEYDLNNTDDLMKALDEMTEPSVAGSATYWAGATANAPTPTFEEPQSASTKSRPHAAPSYSQSSASNNNNNNNRGPTSGAGAEMASGSRNRKQKENLLADLF